jgi:hypothetical protein
VPPNVGGRNGCLQALAILIGVVMLLPGICGIILVGIDSKEMMLDGTVAHAAFGLILIGIGGVALIWWAVRR